MCGFSRAFILGEGSFAYQDRIILGREMRIRCAQRCFACLPNRGVMEGAAQRYEPSAGLLTRLGAWPTTRLAAPWWEAVPVWMPFLGTEWDGQAD